MLIFIVDNFNLCTVKKDKNEDYVCNTNFMTCMTILSCSEEQVLKAHQQANNVLFDIQNEVLTIIEVKKKTRGLYNYSFCNNKISKFAVF